MKNFGTSMFPNLDTSKMTDEEFIFHVKMKNMEDLAKGVELGWWEDFDDKGPIKVFKVNKSDFKENATMAHVIINVIVKPFQCPFESISDARKKGWNKPITIGGHLLNKGRIRIDVL